MKSIFVSSTFMDMQYERDCLNTLVMPKLNELAKKYGDSVALCDLRWGINTYGMDEEQANKKILDACLQEIDNCRPYMIVFLGERYGWVPGEQLIRRAIDDYSAFELPDYDISVTALEIEYGAFISPEQLKHTLFYFRENTGNAPEGYSERELAMRDKLAALKQRIKSVEGAHVYSYRLDWSGNSETPAGLDALAQRITADVAAMMVGEWERSARLSATERESLIQWSHAQNNAQNFYARPTNLDLCNYLLDNKQPFFVLTGGDGSGKTALISKLACDRRQAGINVLPVFCGLTACSSDNAKIVKYVIDYLKDTFGAPFEKFDTVDADGDDDRMRNMFAAAIEACGVIGAKIELYFDEVNLLCGESIANLPYFCDTIPLNVSIVFSCAQSELLPKGCPYLFGHSLDYFDTEHIMKSQLKGTRKELDYTVLKEIFYKKGSASPLFLRLMLQRLTLLDRTDFRQIAEKGGDISAIIEHQVKVIRESGDCTVDMCTKLIKVVCDRINPELGEHAIDYICASRNGLSEQQLKQLVEQKSIKWAPLDFRLIMQFLDGLFFLGSDGRYDLAYRSIKSGYNVKPEIYTDLIALIEAQSELSDGDCAAYVHYCLCAQNHGAYLNFLLAHADRWRVAAKASFDAVQFALRRVMSDDARTKFMREWARGLLSVAKEMGAEKALRAFIGRDYNAACISHVVLFRVVAREIFGDWDTVDRIQITASLWKAPSPADYFDSFTDILIQWRAEQKSAPPAVRREHPIAQQFREHELEIAGHKFYFFNIPRAEDRQLFFMRHDCVLLMFERSTVGDHCTYDVVYDHTDGSLTVTESDFNHYDVESDVSVYRFDDPLADAPKYELTRGTRRGAYNLPLHFDIKKSN